LVPFRIRSRPRRPQTPSLGDPNNPLNLPTREVRCQLHSLGTVSSRSDNPLNLPTRKYPPTVIPPLGIPSPLHPGFPPLGSVTTLSISLPGRNRSRDKPFLSAQPTQGLPTRKTSPASPPLSPRIVAGLSILSSPFTLRVAE
jgi:hypothetical protein